MALTLTNMGLIEWDQPTDHFSYTDLASNWNKVDIHDHTVGKGVQIPTGGIANLAVTLQKIADLGVGTTKIANLGVTTAKIADANVTTAKIADQNVTTIKIADSNVTLAKLAAAVAQALVPVGTILPYGGAVGSPPAGYLICQGGEFARATYPALDAVIGTTFGAYTNGSGAGGTTHFRVPDLRGRSPLGAGAGAGLTNRVLGTTGGEESHLLSTTELASHNHGISITTDTQGSHTHTIDVPGFAGGEHSSGDGSMTVWPTGPPNIGSDWLLAKSAGSHSHNVNGTSGSQGGNTAHNNMQPWLAVNYIIKT
jgi:microcystin-dependent protein